MPLHEPETTGLCRHCGLPPERAPASAECPSRKLAEPAMRACAAIGLEFVEYQTDPVTKIGFAVVRSKLLGDSGCERFYDEQIAKVLEILDRLRAMEEDVADMLGIGLESALGEMNDERI